MKNCDKEKKRMKRKIKSSQKGAISVFVMITMVFFLLTILGAYMISSKRAQTQTESAKLVQGQYYTENEENERYHSKIADSSAIIPIYTKEQLWSIGSGKAIEIEGKVYTFSSGASYELKNDVVINIEGLEGSNVIDESKINKNHYEIYYYYNQDYYVPTTAENSKLSINGNYYAYKNLSKNLGYVTEGLVAHYDGIKNTAMGHNASSVMWKDLSGNGNDGNLMNFSSNPWKDNSLTFDGVDDYLSNIVISNTEGLTFQVVMKNNVTSQYRNIYDRHNGQVPMLWLNPNSKFEFSANHDWGTLTQDYNTRLISVTNAMTKTTSNMSINGVKVIQDFNHTKEIEGTYQLFNRNGGQTYQGEIYSLRIYKKCLTDAEVQKNYEIDKLRFGIE